jgi:hypothetical protein
MRIKRTFHKYNDGGHGWLKVPFSLIVSLKIKDLVSRYSYQRGDFVYLEEDGDMDYFFDAAEKVGLQIKVIEHSTDRHCKIRSYLSYTGELK